MLNHYTTWESMLTGRSWDRWNMGGSSVCVLLAPSSWAGWVVWCCQGRSETASRQPPRLTKHHWIDGEGDGHSSTDLLLQVQARLSFIIHIK